MRTRPRIFFGWYIVGLAIIGMGLILGIRNSFSVLFGPILDSFGWLRSSTALMLSLNVLVSGLTAPFAGALVDRWKPRRVVVIGGFVVAGATAACSLATHLWHFYLLFGVVLPIGTSFIAAPVLNPALINWFGKARGLAIGLGQIGGGLSFAYSFVTESVVNATHSWRPAFLVMAATILVVVLPLYLLFFWFRPEDKGMRPYGSEEAATEVKPDTAEIPVTAGRTDWTLKAALKTPNLWGLVLAQFFYWGIGNYMILAHQIRFATEIGYSSVLATSVFALFGLVSIGGQVAASISDKIGREWTAVIGVVMTVIAMVALLQVHNDTTVWLLYVYSVFSGIGTGLFTPQIFAGVGDIFHGRNIGTISAFIVTGLGVGGAIGPWLGGYIYDLTGSYTVAFYIALGAFLAGGTCFVLAAPRKAERIRARLAQRRA